MMRQELHYRVATREDATRAAGGSSTAPPYLILEMIESHSVDDDEQKGDAVGVVVESAESCNEASFPTTVDNRRATSNNSNKSGKVQLHFDEDARNTEISLSNERPRPRLPDNARGMKD